MNINPIRLTNNYNTNAYKFPRFSGNSANAESLTTGSTQAATADSTQFKSSVKSKDNNRQTFAHKLYKTIANTVLLSANDPYYPVGSSSRSFLY